MRNLRKALLNLNNAAYVLVAMIGCAYLAVMTGRPIFFGFIMFCAVWMGLLLRKARRQLKRARAKL